MTTYYLSPDGSDSTSGSESAPWFSIAHAANNVSPGDTIVMRDGNYNYGSAVQELGNSGTSSDPITITADSGASPTLVWSGDVIGWENTTSEGLLIRNVENWIIDGLEFTRSHSWGVHIRDSNRITVRNCVAQNNAGPGLGATHSGDNILFKNCKAYENGVMGQTTGDGDGFICNGGGDYMGVTFDGCDAWANTDDGIDCLDSRGSTVRGCRAWDNGRTGSSTDGSGMGIKMGGGQNNSGDAYVYNCMAWENEADGITDNIAHNPMVFHNCTAWNNGAADFRFSDNGGAHEVRNCAHDEGDGNVVVHSGVDDDYCTWTEGITDPQFRSKDATDEANFLCLSEESPCINVGTDVGLPYSGAAPDLGAIEFETDPDDESGSQSGPGFYYHDGAEWKEVPLQYHNGEEFV